MYSSCYSCEILMKLLGRFSKKKYSISNFVKIRPVGAVVFYAHGLIGQTGSQK